jgi:nicotinate-nucleotide pyrophosphorylase (carboxylating)
MDKRLFADFFADETRGGLARVLRVLELALEEDGEDLTSRGIFSPRARLEACILAKGTSTVAGLPLIPLIMERCGREPWSLKTFVEEGAVAQAGSELLRLEGNARSLLGAERSILNYLAHLSGIAELTNRYARRLDGTGVRLLDTRKTLPGLRGLEKYAVRVGGGCNHRHNLSEMLMIKDNHIDAAGSITRAVERVRASCGAACPPVEVECRCLSEVREALACGVARIMLDNMEPSALAEALPLIPPRVEAEVSGGVTLENIRSLALASPRRPDYVSVGRITHSAPAADFSMRICRSC